MLACDFRILAHGVFEFDAPGVDGVWYNHFLCSPVGADLHHCLNLKEKASWKTPNTFKSDILQQHFGFPVDSADSNRATT